MKSIWKLIFVVAICVICQLDAQAHQRGGKAPPPEAREPEPPPPPDLDAFEVAYQKAGDPRILVLAGVDTLKLDKGQRGDQQAVASGQVQAGMHLGTRLAFFDSTGDAAAIKTSVEEILNAADIRLVSLDALAEADRREIELADARDDDEAIRLLGSKTNADVILVIRLLGGAEVAARGASYRVFVEAYQAGAARKMTGFMFDWKGELDAGAIKYYAQNITRKFIEQFVAYYSRRAGPTNTFRVRLIDIHDVAQLRKVRDAAKKISGVKRVYDADQQSAGGRTVATIELKYDGSLFDLAADLQEKLTAEIGMKVNALDSSNGAITLAAAPKEKPRGVGTILMDPSDPQHSEKMRAFREAYAQRGSPKIAVIVNREMTEEDQKDAKLKEENDLLKKQIAAAAAAAAGKSGTGGGTGSTSTQPTGGNQATGPGSPAGASNVGSGALQQNQMGVTIVLAPPNQGPNNDREREERERERERREREQEARAKPNAEQNVGRALDTRRVENKVFKRLVALGVEAIDADVARAKLAARMDKERRVFGANELALLLGQAAQTDIVVSGVGRVDATGAGQTVTFTFRAVRTGGGGVLAAADQSIGIPNDKWITETAFDKVADDIVGSLAEQMMLGWLPPSRLQVTVLNADGPREVSTIMQFFKDNISGVRSTNFESHEAGQGTGVGIFSISYDTTYEELLKTVTEMSNGKLPFDLESGDNRRDAMTIRVKRG